MLTVLKDWKGPVEINGQHFDSIQSADLLFKRFSGKIHIKLLSNSKKAKEGQNNENQSINQIEDDNKQYRITVKAYMTKKSSPEFDFMAKWNNDNPMPMRTMVGWIEKETPGMVYMHLHGQAIDNEIKCTRCGRQLTNPISRRYGIGPECLSKVGFVGEIDDVENIKEKIVEVKWQGWVIKKAIECQEAV